MNTNAKLYCNNYYHIYNRTNNKEALFRSDENREFFLRQYQKYLGPYIDIFAYALMSNHFHFNIRVKDLETINSHISSLHENELTVALKNYKRDRIASSDAISDVLISQHRRFL